MVLAPKTFLIPISFVRCSAVKAANPNNPKQAIKMAKAAQTAKNNMHTCTIQTESASSPGLSTPFQTELTNTRVHITAVDAQNLR